MGLIIGLAGKKSSGKTSLVKFLKEELFKYKSVGVYPYAAPLKKLCIDILGLTERQCYGSDEDKKSLTRYKWEDMPFYTDYCNKIKNQIVKEISQRYNIDSDAVFTDCYYIEYSVLSSERIPKGFMTAREVLQTVGTEIFRKMYSDVWVEANLRLIAKENKQIAIIDDVRFPNEADALKEHTLIRLCRAPYADSDFHASETALDDYKFEKVLHNDQMNLEDSKVSLAQLLLDAKVYDPGDSNYILDKMFAS